ncbi:unnamed protein product [Prorocentrum cordatum]|uniref:Uncharacterized protein n=1 Tax=Prorocentrum cordatum TaxID=2364126 RepID=A0ABN9SEL0_9DINO|nr:unnamed protein product [Polarella glacialis]
MWLPLLKPFSYASPRRPRDDQDWCMVVGQVAQAAILGAANIGGAWLGRCPACPPQPGCPAPALSCPPVSLTCPAPPAPPVLTCPQVTCAAPACPPCEAPAREDVTPCPSPAREDAGADGRVYACLPLWAVVLIAAGALVEDSMLAVVSSSDLVPGDVILVRYAADDLWHERVLCWALPADKSGAVHWVVATPDGDMYVETIEGGSPDDSPVEWIRPAADGRLPAGFQDAVYSFQRGEIDGALLEKCVKKGATMALKGAKEHGEAPVSMAPGGRRVPIEDVVGVGFVQPALRDGVPDVAESGGGVVAGIATPGTGVWRVVEEGNSLGYDVGREVKPVMVYIGCKGVYLPDGKDAVFVEFSDEGEADFVKRVAPRPRPKEAPAQDARTLAIKFNPQGRMRDWRDVVDSCQQEDFEDFPVSGPRSMSWCLHFLRRRHTPLDHHLMFRSTCSLKPEQWGVAEHETLLRIIELAGQYDQLDVTNLACMEAAARRVQTIEWAYHDKIRETDAGSTSRLSIEEATAFSGLSRAGDLMMVAPALLEHAKLQVEKDAAIMKNIRKAKEERELRRKDNKGNNKDKEKGRRILRRQAVASLANQAIYTLNDLAGAERGSSVSQPGEGRAPHVVVQRRVYAAAAAMGPPPALSPSGALQELRGCTVHEDVQSTVVPFDDMKRLVVDCRRSNCWFSAADPVELSAGAGLGNLEVPDGARLRVGHVDIKDAFYHFELPERVRNLFAPPAAPAWMAGLAEVGGVIVSPGTPVYPRLRVHPMGWPRALRVCQTLHRRIIQDIPGLEPTSFLHGRGPAPATTPACHTVYVDNFLALGTCRSTVERLVRQEEVLGWEINGRLGFIRPRPERAWRIRLALDGLLESRRVSARDIEKVVGHCTFLALLSRTSLSIFQSVYTFIARHRDHGTVPLWDSVRWELEAFRNVIPLIRCDFGAPWSSKVMASDASFWGYGVVSRDLPPDTVQQLGRVSERWRFSGKAQVRSREGVLGPDGELDIGDWVKKVEEDSQEREDALSDLPEVLKERGWAVLMSKKWEVPIFNIVQGEDGHPLGVCAALRSVAAHGLATGAVFSGRWFPSQWNHADGPSRGLGHSGHGGASAGKVDARSDHCAAGDSCGAAWGPEVARAHLPSAGLPSAGSATAEGVLAAERGNGRLLAGTCPRLLRSAATQRKAARRALRLPVAGRQRYLQARSVRTEAVRRRYSEFLDELDQWLGLSGLSRRPCPSGPLGAGAVGQFDQDVSDWMNEQYMEGYDHWRGSNLMAAIAWADPRLGRALKGWRNLTPVVFAIAMELMVMDRWDMALCTMLPLVFLMRPGDWRTEPLFAFSQAEFARCFKMAGAKLLLQRPPPPCILRHSGASRDFAEQRRTLGHARWCLRYLPAALFGSLRPRGFRAL